MRLLMRRRYFASIGMILFTTKGMVAFGQGRDRLVAPEEKDEAQTAASDLLNKIDKVPLSADELRSLYSSSGLALKNRYDVQAYDARLRSVRGPLGPVKSRTFAGFGGAYLTLPNIMPGDYMIIGFRTLFGDSNVVYTEQVTLEKDRGGAKKFRLVEYYVAPLSDSK